MLANILLSASNGLNVAVQFVTVLLLFVFVLAITYATTRWIANYQKGKTFSKNIDIIETYKITPNKYIQIVRTGEKYVVIAIAKDTVTMLTELTQDQLTIINESEQPRLDFKELLEKAKNRKAKE